MDFSIYQRFDFLFPDILARLVIILFVNITNDLSLFFSILEILFII
jgi:hypothetical protein